MTSDLWLVGTGGMAEDYLKVLRALEVHPTVVGRGEQSASRFEKRTAATVIRGGLAGALDHREVPRRAIVAVQVNLLTTVALELIEAGVKAVLLEKPGALSSREMARVVTSAAEHSCAVFVAYNRRFLASSIAARKVIADDGGASVLRMQIVEWAREIVQLDFPREVLSRWLIANSSHVIDLGFHLAGHPEEWTSYRLGSLPWHDAFYAFTCSGRLHGGGVFSAWADWRAPGRWGLDIATAQRDLAFRPLERLVVSSHGTEDSVICADTCDEQFKPGLFRQTQTFLLDDDRFLCPAAEQLSLLRFCEDIAGYGPGNAVADL